METLVKKGWLFRVDLSSSTQTGIGDGWMYWREFDFPKVEWWAIKSATTNMTLLVVIGVLNLPIFVPALAHRLDVPYDMDHEFLGQGVANLLAGITGTVPNILVGLYSVMLPVSVIKSQTSNIPTRFLLPKSAEVASNWVS